MTLGRRECTGMASFTDLVAELLHFKLLGKR